MPNILAEIELNEKQIKAFNEELNKWKEKTKAQLADEVKSELQTEFDVKLREIEEEKENFKTEQTRLVEDIKSKMQKVMVKRFTTALKETYDELKVEARKEVLNDPRITALEEIKNVVYPLMDETVTKGYVDELAKSLQMIESKDGQIDRLKAKLKLKEITSTLSPVVVEAVEAFIGDAASEEEVVEKYSRLKNLVSEASDDEDMEMPEEEPKKKKGKKDKKDDDEDGEDLDMDADEEEEEEEEEDESPEEEEEEGSEGEEEEEEEEPAEEEEGKKKGKSKKDKKDKDEEEPEMEEDLEIRPQVHFEKNDRVEKNDYLNTLNEMLDLAGVPK